MVVTREQSRPTGVVTRRGGNSNRGGGNPNRGGGNSNRGGGNPNRVGGNPIRGRGNPNRGGVGVNRRAGGGLQRGGGGVRTRGGRQTAAFARGKGVDASTSQAPPPHSSGEGTARTRDGVPEDLPPVLEDGSTSRSQRQTAGDYTATTPLQRPRSSGADGGSSQSSRRRTPDSQATVSATATLRQQFGASGNRLPFAALTSQAQAPSNHQINRDPQQQAHLFDQPEPAAFDNEDEEYEEDEGEELDGEEHLAEENEADQEGYYVPPVGGDDQELLDNILALPGRDRLPLLSEVPKPDTFW